MRHLSAAVLTLLLFGSDNPLQGQEAAWDPGQVRARRQDLEALVQRYADAAQSRAYSQGLRERARAEAERIRARLATGDFRAGDRIVVAVEGQEQLSDTFVVSGERELVMPIVGTVPMSGVLRSEIETHLRQSIGTVVRDPVVQAHSLVRIAILGEIGQPGFHLLPPEMPISEALMAVGGPSPNADLSKLEARRGETTVAGGEAMRLALQGGLTLDELGLRAGDQIVVSKRSPFAAGEIGRSLLYVVGAAGSLFYALQFIR